MKVKAYHGTTPEGAKALLSGVEAPERIWAASEEDKLYLWCPHALIEGGEFDEDEDSEYIQDRAIQMAAESAQVTASVSGFVTKLVILEFEFDLEDIEPDDSCGGDRMGLARCVEGLDYKACHTGTYQAAHNPFLNPFHARFLKENPYFDWDALADDNPELADAVEAIGETEFYPEIPDPQLVIFDCILEALTGLSA
jgi:hypothetical protein